MHKFLTDDELDAISKRVDAAQRGPWKSFIEGRDHDCGSSIIQTGESADRGEDIEMSGATDADYDFILTFQQVLSLNNISTLRLAKE